MTSEKVSTRLAALRGMYHCRLKEFDAAEEALNDLEVYGTYGDKIHFLCFLILSLIGNENLEEAKRAIIHLRFVIHRTINARSDEIGKRLVGEVNRAMADPNWEIEIG